MNTNRPLMLGIVGDSGAGKTTLTRGVVRILGHNGVTPICLDDYHRYSRAERAARGLTAADPSANDLSLMAEHLATLRTGGTIQKPVYDHRSGELRAPEAVAATGLVIAYGMLTLTPLYMASLFDLTVFLDPDDTLHHVWKLNRDTAERGYAAEQVLALRRANDDAAMRYISVQRRYANLVIRFHAPRDAQLTSGSLPLTVDLLFRRTPALLLLEPILEFIGQQALRGIRISRGIIDEDGCTSDRLSINSRLEPATYMDLLNQIWPHNPNYPPLPLTQIGMPGSGTPHSKILALVQVLVASLLVRSLN